MASDSARVGGAISVDGPGTGVGVRLGPSSGVPGRGVPGDCVRSRSLELLTISRFARRRASFSCTFDARVRISSLRWRVGVDGRALPEGARLSLCFGGS